MPGRVIQSVRRAESRNPVFMLDEVDKLGRDFRGDPSSALLEVLDPEQNAEFRDHYLDVPFDLSQVFFITTANWLDTIPQPLLDRMEIIQLSSYTEEEKVKIAQGYLVPRQIKENGLRIDEVRFEETALRRMAGEYTREAGVRALERQIGTVCRKVATKVAENGGSETPVTITAENVNEFLGRPKFLPEVADRVEVPGVATGLAWTPVGGDVLFLEATRMTGSKGFMLTGQLGDVMKESAQAAMSWVRSKAKDYGIDEEFFAKSDIHLHIPAGATPKDGPSAGVTMATALVSLLTGRPIRKEVGMTGEITLARPGAAHRRDQGEGAGGQPVRADHRHPAQAQRGGSGGRARGRAVEDELHLCGAGGGCGGRGVDAGVHHEAGRWRRRWRRRRTATGRGTRPDDGLKLVPCSETGGRMANRVAKDFVMSPRWLRSCPGVCC